MSDANTLDFDRAEPAAGTAEGLRCAACSEPIATWYWQVNGAIACERCKGALVRERATRRPARFLVAGLYGTVAAAAGAGLYYAIAAATGYELGLVGIVVGLAVGIAVKKGARGRGGWAYQSLAMFLTYMAIVSTYVPGIITALRQRAAEDTAGQSAEIAANAAGTPARPAPAAPPAAAPAPATTDAPAPSAPTPASASTGPDRARPSAGALVVGVLVIFGLAMALPFLAGFQNIMGIAIIGFALFEAWKLNRAQPLAVTGPFDARAAAGGGAATVG